MPPTFVCVCVSTLVSVLHLSPSLPISSLSPASCHSLFLIHHIIEDDGKVSLLHSCLHGNLQKKQNIKASRQPVEFAEALGCWVQEEMGDGHLEVCETSGLAGCEGTKIFFSAAYGQIPRHKIDINIYQLLCSQLAHYDLCGS